MTALNPNNTERWWLDYTVNGHQHHIMMRTISGASSSDVSDTFDGLFTILSPDLYAVTVDDFRRALRLSNVTLPIPYLGSTTYGTGAGTGNDVPKFVSFTGRDNEGHKGRLEVFGWNGPQPADWRINAGEDSIIDAAVAYLVALDGFFLSINERDMTWHSYANYGLARYWQRVLRT